MDTVLENLMVAYIVTKFPVFNGSVMYIIVLTLFIPFCDTSTTITIFNTTTTTTTTTTIITTTLDSAG